MADTPIKHALATEALAGKVAIVTGKADQADIYNHVKDMEV